MATSCRHPVNLDIEQPGFAKNELHRGDRRDFSERQPGCVDLFRDTATPLGLWAGETLSQGSSFLTTLGWRPEFLWDSWMEFSEGVCGKRLRYYPLVFRPRALLIPFEEIVREDFEGGGATVEGLEGGEGFGG